MVDLHDNGRHHIGRLPLLYERFKRAGGNRFPFLHDNEGRNVFSAAALVVISLHGHILDRWILTDHRFDLR